MTHPDPLINSIIEASYRELSLRGDLSWYLDESQQGIYAHFKNTTENLFVFNACRQIGKSRLIMSIAFMECLTHPNYRVLVVMPTLNQARTVSYKEAEGILKHIPDQVTYKSTENSYVFNNGSKITVRGAPDSSNAENLRGLTMNLILVDEAGFFKQDLYIYLLDSILKPMLLTTRGRLFLASTPPKEGQNHPYVMYANLAQSTDSFVTKTIFDNPRMTVQDIEQKAKESGGPESATFLREYMARLDIVDADFKVIYAFTSDIEASCVRQYPTPAYINRTVSIDLGFSPDNTGIVLGYYDYINNKYVIQSEALLKRADTANIATTIKYLENITWPDYTAYRRVTDIDQRLQADLWSLHNLAVSPTPKPKDGNRADINKLNLLIQSNQLIISPSCKDLIFQVKTATYKTQERLDWGRDASGGHFDLLAALIYFIRNVPTNNPYPSHIPLPRPSDNESPTVPMPKVDTQPSWIKSYNVSKAFSLNNKFALKNSKFQELVKKYKVT